MAKTFFAQSQMGNDNSLAFGFLDGHTLTFQGNPVADGGADKMVLDWDYYNANFVTVVSSTIFDHLYAEGTGLNPNTRGGYGTYEVRMGGQPATSPSSGKGNRWQVGVLEFKDNGPTVTIPGAGYASPAYPYGTLRFDQGPREGVLIVVTADPVSSGSTLEMRLTIWARGWQMDNTGSPINGSLPAFKQYTTAVISRTDVGEFAFDVDLNVIPTVEYQVRTTVDADGFGYYVQLTDGSYLDLWSLVSPADQAGILDIITNYRVPGAVPVGHARRVGIAPFVNYDKFPYISIVPDPPPPPEPIDCCPPLPQRTDPGCGDTSCGQAFKKTTIGWDDSLKVDGEYTFPESRLYPVETVKVGIPVGRETRHYRLTIGSALWAPLTIAAVEWTGQYFNNARRTG